MVNIGNYFTLPLGIDVTLAMVSARLRPTIYGAFWNTSHRNMSRSSVILAIGSTAERLLSINLWWHIISGMVPGVWNWVGRK